MIDLLDFYNQARTIDWHYDNIDSYRNWVIASNRAADFQQKASQDPMLRGILEAVRSASLGGAPIPSLKDIIG